MDHTVGERRISFLLVGGCLGLMSMTILAVCAGCFVLLKRSLPENEHVIPSDEQERRFHENRPVFEEYIRRLEKERARDDRQLPELPDQLRRADIFCVKERAAGRIILFEWRSHPL